MLARINAPVLSTARNLFTEHRLFIIRSLSLVPGGHSDSIPVMMLLSAPTADHRFDSVVQGKSGFIPSASSGVLQEGLRARGSTECIETHKAVVSRAFAGAMVPPAL